MKKRNEFQKFDETMRALLRVPHDELKAALEAEKRGAKQKPKARPSASGRVSGGKG